MNARIFSIVLAVTILSVSNGCTCMKNFLFGKGARCGQSASNQGGYLGPQFGNTMQAPFQSSGCGASQAAPGPGCGCQSYAQAPSAGSYSCGSCGSHAGDCGCQYADPYMSGGSVTVPPGGTGVPIQTDDFSARRFDSDGSRIIWEESYGS